MDDKKTNLPIVFVLTRHVYDSYVDMRQLINLSGYSTIYSDEMDFTKYVIYIIITINGDVRANLEHQRDNISPRNAHVISWVLERPSSEDGSVSTFGKTNRQLIMDRMVDEIWVSDKRLAQETSLRYVTLGSHYELGEPGNDKKFDFCHMSYTVPRRQTIYNYFMNVGRNGWGQERHEVLQKSKFALNVHQDNFPFCEPLRLALFAAYGLPVISEQIYDSHPYYEHIISGIYDDLPDLIKECLKDPYEKYKEMGQKFRKLMCEEFGFRKMVDEAIYVHGLH